MPNDYEDNRDILSLKHIRNIMDGITEPATKWNGILVWMTFALSLTGIWHWMGPIDADLIEEYGREYAESLMYNGEIRNVIGGVPDYFLQSTLWLAAAIITGILATLQWNVDVSETEIKASLDPAEPVNDNVAGKSEGRTKTSGSQTEMTLLTADV